MYATHRKRFLERLRAERAAAFVPTASAKVRNHDCEYRFRPDSDFWYLSGFDEPEAALVLLPGSGERGDRSVLFLRERDPEREVWTGRRLGVDAAPARLGVDEAYPIAELWTRLPELLKGYERLVYKSAVEPDRDRKLLEALARVKTLARGTLRPTTELVDPLPILHEMRLKKGAEELACMRRAAGITAEAHLLAMARAAPGVGENEVDALLEYTFRRRGATGAAYNNIVAGGANACILHYERNDAELRDGELLLVDAGCEWEYYASDVTRTFPVNGSFSPEQRALYDVVLGAQLAGVDAVRPGVSFDSVHERARRELVAGLVRLGLVEGPLDKALEAEDYKRHFMHRTSHWLGLDVHDCGYYAVDGASRNLEPGMVLTVEPGLYVPPDDPCAEARWRGIGIRIEDDVLVTAKGHEVLTAAIPKGVDEVEAACRAPEVAAAP